MPVKDPTKETIFMEFDRSHNDLIEVKEFLKGLQKRAKSEMTCKPTRLGPKAHILDDEAPDNDHEYLPDPGMSLY